MTYLVKREIVGPAGKLSPGTLLEDPSWPAQNLRALVSMGSLEVVHNTNVLERVVEPPKVPGKKLWGKPS